MCVCVYINIYTYIYIYFTHKWNLITHNRDEAKCQPLFVYWLFVAKKLWVKWFTVAGKPSVACEYRINKDESVNLCGLVNQFGLQTRLQHTERMF